MCQEKKFSTQIKAQRTETDSIKSGQYVLGGHKIHIHRISGRQAAPYSSRLRFPNQDTHTNIQTYIQKDRPGF